MIVFNKNYFTIEYAFFENEKFSKEMSLIKECFSTRNETKAITNETFIIISTNVFDVGRSRIYLDK